MVDECIGGKFKEERIPGVVYRKSPVKDLGVVIEVGPEAYFRTEEEMEVERLETERRKKEKE